MEQSGASAIDLFNGVSTHFLSECPGQGPEESVGRCLGGYPSMLVN